MAGNINIALLGSKMMGRAHSNAWLNVSKFFDRAAASAARPTEADESETTP